MKPGRLLDYLDHMHKAAANALAFTQGMNLDDFRGDERTQQAVVMSLFVIGEAATKVMGSFAEFSQAHPQVPWQYMRGMRNRIAHGYFDIDLAVVWETVQTALPQLLRQLETLRADASGGDQS